MPATSLSGCTAHVQPDKPVARRPPVTAGRRRARPPCARVSARPAHPPGRWFPSAGTGSPSRAGDERPGARVRERDLSPVRAPVSGAARTEQRAIGSLGFARVQDGRRARPPEEGHDRFSTDHGSKGTRTYGPQPWTPVTGRVTNPWAAATLRRDGRQDSRDQISPAGGGRNATGKTKREGDACAAARSRHTTPFPTGASLPARRRRVRFRFHRRAAVAFQDERSRRRI